MIKKKNLLRKDILKIILLVVVFLIFQVLLMRANTIEALGVYKGVILSLQYGVCLLIMLVNIKRGSRIAVVLMGISVLVMGIITLKGSRETVSGLFNAIFYIITIIVIARYDIRRETESRTDFITKVYNRRGLYLELAEKITKGIEFNIIYVSLNNFKSINDTYGHAYGDELLCKISRRIKTKFDKDCIVARIGGSEFVVAVDGKQDAQLIADKLLEIIREKAELFVDDVRVVCYVEGFAGVSNYPRDAKDSESLIKYADIAMSEAINNKAKQACLFSAEMLDRINRQVQLRNLIKDSLANDYFYLVYQPQFEVGSKKLRGFEALIRMKTTDGDLISPGEFIPVAEKSDLILQIDDYVLERAMREFKDIVIKNPTLTISINVSAKNFADIGFVEKIKQVIDRTEFPATNLEIEITEYCMVNSIDTTTDNIIELRKLGVQVALDDFGTGYTSLNYVASLPIDLLKLDKSLIDDIESDRKRRDFVKAVITMGQLMECKIIAEGVENDGQVVCLIEDGCDYVQGFVWSRPLMYEDAIKLT